ncbi:MAG: tetratricopeptide repeat protein [Kofleriaceae bacterium]|jgi:tetratricopeptide (TPR) repeat protein|nr:tetratricopeptide repeat protein [Kofleriaceae bacterium]
MSDVIPLRPRRPGGHVQRHPVRRAPVATDWYQRGVALEAVDPVAAAEAYRRALEARPDLADAHNNLGRLQHEAGHLGAAEAHYRRALATDPGVGLYWFNLGVVLEDQARPGDARSAYQQAVEHAPDLAEAHFNLAHLLERAGDLDSMRAAIRHLHRYRALTRGRRTA